MKEPYVIRYGDMYVHGFSSEKLSPVWTLELDDANWMEEDKAREWVRFLTRVFNLSGLEIEKV